jgi:hypothetical protein
MKKKSKRLPHFFTASSIPRIHFLNPNGFNNSLVIFSHFLSLLRPMIDVIYQEMIKRQQLWLS